MLFLDLSLNNLSGPIPPEVFSIASLSISLDLSDNRLTGALPSEVGNLRNLGVLDVSNNMFSGEIPNIIGSCTALEYLSMKGNFFQGSIPSSFSPLRGIRNLDLPRNNLSGKIPEFLQEFDFQLLNLSCNDFEGMLPMKGVFKNLSATWIMGNSKLCGGIPEFHLPKCYFKKPKKVKVGPKTIDCVFIGYAQNSNAYHFLVHKSEIPNIHVNTIIESRDDSFFENIFPYNIVYESIDNNKRSQDTISRSDSMEDEPRRSKRQRTSTSFGPDFLTYLLENELWTFKEVVTSPEAPFWKEAISIVKLNPYCQIIHGIWLTFLLVINHYNVSGFSRGK